MATTTTGPEELTFSTTRSPEADASDFGASTEENKLSPAETLQKGYKTMLRQSVLAPEKLVSDPKVATIKVGDRHLIDQRVGDAGAATTGTVTQPSDAVLAEGPTPFDAATYTADTAQPKTEAALQDVSAAQGTVSQDAQVTAAQGDPSQLSQLQLEAAQAQHVTVDPTGARTLQPGEIVEGSAVDMEEVKREADIIAATADPTRKATVQGQLEDLYASFDAENPPAWAAGAMRTATAEMQRRGLGASSIAGMAIVQAAMESALPIAQMDAQTYAQFEGQNLSNRQQAAVLSAQQRAQFLGQKFDQNFQTRVANASRIADIANMNFTAEQQIALENARLAQSTNLANLSASNAKVLADAAAMSQMDLTNLSNAQQAAVENAKSFLQMDMANLSNEQQTSMFKAQAMQSAILSDTAANNAARQFNATSENQVNQFMESLKANTSQFNASQQNAMEQFAVSEANAMEQFNTSQINQRDQFNTSNALLISQANAQWRQTATTLNTAAKNEANMFAAKSATEITMATLDQTWQRERDLMDYAFRSTEGAKDRALQIILGDKQLAEYRAARKSEEKGAMVSSFFKLFSLF